MSLHSFSQCINTTTTNTKEKQQVKLEIGRSFELEVTLWSLFLSIGKRELFACWHPNSLEFVTDTAPR